MFHIFAHVKWFVGHDPNASIAKFSLAEWFVSILLAAFGLCLLYIVNKYYRSNSINNLLNKKLGKYEWAVPVAVRWSTGLLLLLNYFDKLLFAPNVAVGPAVIAKYISVMFAGIGVMLILGLLPRISGAFLVALYLVSLLTIHPTPDVLDHIEYIGIGAYLAIRGGGRFCLYKEKISLESFKMHSVHLLRIFVGLGLMVLAITEKLQGVAYSSEFLEKYQWNFLHSAGISNRNFILVAGVIEFVVGLSLVLNWAPRVTTAIVLFLMIITASLLGINEVFGHLFAISLVAVVWLNDERHYLRNKL
jgi:uncharacterized membrane protein YphA (DoxX/SURF4 family)